MSYSMLGAGPTGKPGNKLPTGYKQGQMQNYTPEMMEEFRRMGERLGPDSWLSKLAMGDQSQFDELEAPALKQFSGIQGGLASRFSGMGTGATKSSGFKNTMNQAGADFASQLQSQRMGLRNQAMQDLMGYSNMFLNQKPYESFLYEKGQSTGQKLAGTGLRAGGAALGGYFGGAQGANMGYQAGNTFADIFGV